MMAEWCGVLAAVIVLAPAWGQQRFDAPEAAAQAMIDAAERHDSARLAAILGPQAAGILSSGDAAQDSAEQSEFARLARVRHQIEVSPLHRNRAILAIGDEDWPFPVPLRRANGEWSFDASQAPAEMEARRIGADELDAIEVCHGYVEAQQKYASEDRGGQLEYAPRLMSRSGQQDGLYSTATAPLIPEALARAEWEGFRKGDAKPYHGYYFRVLDGQGADARGGAHNYVAKGKTIGGFGLVAWPAEYGVSGIHTFIVNQDGAVYQKDIDPVLGKPASPVTRFDPDHSWERVE